MQAREGPADPKSGRADAPLESEAQMRRMEGGDETKAAGMRWGALRADGLHVTAATKLVSALSETPADGVAAVRSVSAPSLQQLSFAAVRIGDPPLAQHACSLAAGWPGW